MLFEIEISFVLFDIAIYFQGPKLSISILGSLMLYYANKDVSTLIQGRFMQYWNVL